MLDLPLDACFYNIGLRHPLKLGFRTLAEEEILGKWNRRGKCQVGNPQHHGQGPSAASVF